jgi:hypothetical protein
MAYDTPVLLVAWRRPGVLRRVIEAMRRVAPKHVFVACDGPNTSRPGEAEKVARTRQLIEDEINWDCSLERRYSDINQGCRLGVSRAITWFFENVDEGIVLEDDCLPHPDFFRFGEALLRRYRNDPRVWAITGNNFQNGALRGDATYYFSRYNHIWGWATWKRCWAHYDPDLRSWPAWRDSPHFGHCLPDPRERAYWCDRFEEVHAGQVDTWDYQWTAAVWRNGGLTATPQVNLVTNIGFDQDALHTNATGARLRIPLQGLAGTITHPPAVSPHHEADAYTFASVFSDGKSGGGGGAGAFFRYLKGRLFGGVKQQTGSSGGPGEHRPAPCFENGNPPGSRLSP